MKPALSRDTLALVISQAFFNGALAIEVMWLGRWLDRGDLGLYFYALSLGSLLEAGVHWGAQHYLARQAAIAPGKLRRELSLLATGMVCFLSLSGAVLGLAVDLYLALIATAVISISQPSWPRRTIELAAGSRAVSSHSRAVSSSLPVTSQ